MNYWPFLKPDVDADKAALEVEEWKQKQKERFKTQLQGLESHHVNLLTKEWEKREKERENLVHEKLSEIFGVEKELKQALEDNKNKQKSLSLKETELEAKEKKLDEREQKLQSLLGGNTTKKVILFNLYLYHNSSLLFSEVKFIYSEKAKIFAKSSPYFCPM